MSHADTETYGRAGKTTHFRCRRKTVDPGTTRSAARGTTATDPSEFSRACNPWRRRGEWTTSGGKPNATGNGCSAADQTRVDGLPLGTTIVIVVVVISPSLPSDTDFLRISTIKLQPSAPDKRTIRVDVTRRWCSQHERRHDYERNTHGPRHRRTATRTNRLVTTDKWPQ